MADGTITHKDVEEFGRHIDAQIKAKDPQAARKRLIESGTLTPDGKPTWPQQQGSKRASSR